jgi:multicomponent Na+:H+ antiporter subunit E
MRGGLLLGFWLLLSALDLSTLLRDPIGASADLMMALLATTLATWVSLRLWPPSSRRPRLGALVSLIGQFLVQSVVAGVDIARRVLDPRLPLQPGFVVFSSGLQSPARRAVFATLSSAMPGALAVGTNAEGALVYHCLDTRLPIAAGLARDERRLMHVYGEAPR